MCGIAGIVSFDHRPVSEQEIQILTDAVAHRGPDSRGVWFNSDVTVALGHRRLSILDLSEAGRQPLCYDGRYWITLNGEIYNFIELRDELRAKGHKFHTETDTEVILAAYKEWGIGMHDRFNGMWAFAIYDIQEELLLLSRDRFGIKPLYYHRSNGKLLFSSEVQAIHKVLGPAHPLNRPVINDILTGNSLSHGTDQTYLRDVLSLPGGCCMQVHDGGLELVEWYQLKSVPVPASLPEQAAMLRMLLDDACRLRLRSDVPVGTCLSGGIDSSSIAAVIHKIYAPHSSERFSHYTHRSFCASFPGSPIDESESAKRLAEVLGSALEVKTMPAPKPEELEDALKACDGPMHALAFFPIWSLYRHIRQQGILVTLDGQGPDEMLGGYRPLREGLEAAYAMRSPGWFIDLYHTYRELGETAQFSSKKIADDTLKQFLFLHLGKLHPLHLLYRMKRRLSGGVQDKNGMNADCLQLIRQPVGMSNAFDRSLFRQFFQSPLPAILQQYDRCSMASGVECRMPFMDYRIVEFIFSLPVQSKVGKGYTKRVLRDAMKGLLPDATRLNKLKIGFNAPIVDWFRGSLRDFMLLQMSSKGFLESPYFDGKALKQEFEAFLAKPSPQWDEAWKFWPPVHLAWWLEQNKIVIPC